VRPLLALPLAAGLLLLAGCGDEQPASEPRSGVTGTVHLGPQCPVEMPDEPCDDEPAAGVPVTVSEQLPGEAYGAGEVVARGETDADGSFRIAVPPGEYVVTAEAGMSCELMDARVTDGAWTRVDVPCDTGIR
jgi:hypothetical protein